MLVISHRYQGVGSFFFRVKLFLFIERLGALIGTIGEENAGGGDR